MIKKMEHIDEYYDGINCNKYCLLVVESSGCKACHTPQAEQVLKTINNSVDISVLRMEMDSNDQFMELANKLGVRGAPTYILFIDGEEFDRKTGLSNQNILDMITTIKNIDKYDKEDLK
jgi:thioredoxin-related protein